MSNKIDYLHPSSKWTIGLNGLALEKSYPDKAGNSPNLETSTKTQKDEVPKVDTKGIE